MAARNWFVPIFAAALGCDAPEKDASAGDDDTSAGLRPWNESRYFHELTIDLAGLTETKSNGEVWTTVITGDAPDSCLDSTLVTFRTISDDLWGQFHFAAPLAPGLTATLPAAPFPSKVYPLVMVEWQSMPDVVLSGGQVQFRNEEDGIVDFRVSDTRSCSAPGAFADIDLDECTLVSEGSFTFVGTMGTDKEPRIGVPGWEVQVGDDTLPLCVYPNP